MGLFGLSFAATGARKNTIAGDTVLRVCYTRFGEKSARMREKHNRDYRLLRQGHRLLHNGRRICKLTFKNIQIDTKGYSNQRISVISGDCSVI